MAITTTAEAQEEVGNAPLAEEPELVFSASVPLGPLRQQVVEVVFDERWTWPPGSYDVQIMGLVDLMGSPRVVTCLANIPADGFTAGSYSIDLNEEEQAASCAGDVHVHWALLPEVAGGMRIWSMVDVEGIELRVRVTREDGVVLHEASAPVIGSFSDWRYAFLGPVPPTLQYLCDDAGPGWPPLIDCPP